MLRSTNQEVADWQQHSRITYSEIIIKRKIIIMKCHFGGKFTPSCFLLPRVAIPNLGYTFSVGVWWLYVEHGSRQRGEEGAISRVSAQLPVHDM